MNDRRSMRASDVRRGIGRAVIYDDHSLNGRDFSIFVLHDVDPLVAVE